MLHHLMLLTSLLMDGGTTAPPSVTPGTDERTQGAPHLDISELYAGIIARRPIFAAGIHWPGEVRPLATLEGPAVLAAHAAMQHVLARFPKEYAGTCAYSAKALEAIVGEEGGLYFVRINQRPDRCGRFAAGINLTLDWFELYAVSPDGKVLARYPYHP